MKDVERWLVDKEAEKEKENMKESESKPDSPREASSTDNVKEEIHDLRDEVVELQGRLGELGREMAKIATAPNNFPAGPRTQSAAVSVAPQTTSSIFSPSHPTSPFATHLTGSPSAPSTPIHHPRLSSTTARESMSPPMTSKRRESGTRLPYPAGDYSSPPDTFSPGNSPPSSISSAMRPLSTVISGYPSFHPQDWVYYQVLRILPLHSPHWLPVRVGRRPRLRNPSSLLPLLLPIKRPAQHPHQ
ncbi:uncharacterized protein LACBIDRAFT_311044, partial [Laccaria bicolor S238N-H82]